MLDGAFTAARCQALSNQPSVRLHVVARDPAQTGFVVLKGAGWWGAASAGSCTGVGFCATALAVWTSPPLASRSPPSCPASRSCSILYQPKPPQGNPTQTDSGEARVSALVFKNASILDGQQNEALTDHNVLVENGEFHAKQGQGTFLPRSRIST